MKKSSIIITALATSVIVGSGILMTQKPDLFAGWTNSKKKRELTAQEKQLAYLKKHEEELSDFIKELNPKVESVQFDWDSMEVGQIGNGTPQGAGYMITIEARINHIKDSEVTLGIPLKGNSSSLPKRLDIYEMQPIRILRDGVWDIYE